MSSSDKTTERETETADVTADRPNYSDTMPIGTDVTMCLNDVEDGRGGGNAEPHLRRRQGSGRRAQRRRSSRKSWTTLALNELEELREAAMALDDSILPGGGGVCANCDDNGAGEEEEKEFEAGYDSDGNDAEIIRRENAQRLTSLLGRGSASVERCSFRHPLQQSEVLHEASSLSGGSIPGLKMARRRSIGGADNCSVSSSSARRSCGGRSSAACRSEAASLSGSNGPSPVHGGGEEGIRRRRPRIASINMIGSAARNHWSHHSREESRCDSNGPSPVGGGVEGGRRKRHPRRASIDMIGATARHPREESEEEQRRGSTGGAVVGGRGGSSSSSLTGGARGGGGGSGAKQRACKRSFLEALPPLFRGTSGAADAAATADSKEQSYDGPSPSGLCVSFSEFDVDSTDNVEDGDRESVISDCSSDCSSDDGIFNEGWLRADEELIAEVHSASRKAEEEMRAMGMESPFRDVAEIIPTFRNLHHQLGGYSARKGAATFPRPTLTQEPDRPGGEIEEGSPSAPAQLDLGFIANHLFCAETSHLRPTALASVATHSKGDVAGMVEGILAAIRDPMKRHRAEEIDDPWYDHGEPAAEFGAEIGCGDCGGSKGSKGAAEVNVDAEGWKRIHKRLDVAIRTDISPESPTGNGRRERGRGAKDRLLGLLARRGRDNSAYERCLPGECGGGSSNSNTDRGGSCLIDREVEAAAALDGVIVAGGEDNDGVWW